MATADHDAWMKQHLGVAPTPSGARTRVETATDDDGGEVINLLGPSSSPPSHAKPPPPKPAGNTKVPRPMQADCKPVRGHVPGPANHLMCQPHGHVVDITAKLIIANTVRDYAASHPAKAQASPPQPQAAEEGRSGAAPPKAVPATARPAAADPAFPPSVVKGDPREFNHKIVAAAQYAVTLSRENTLKFVGQVESACQDFNNFAAAKLRDFDGQITAGDVMAGLVTALSLEIGGPLAEMAAYAVGQSVARTIAGTLGREFAVRAKAASQESTDIIGLLIAIASLTQAARDSATMIMDGVEKTIGPLADDVIETINNGEQLSARQSDFVMPFFETQAAAGDEELQRYGVPNASSGAAIRMKIFGAMLAAFEEKLILATSSLREKIEMSTRQMLHLEGGTLKDKAKGEADKAVQDRQDAMEGKAPR